MLGRIMCPANYGTFNILLVQHLGLEGAVYLSELLALYDASVSKSKTIDDGYFFVDRQHIESRTKIGLEAQKELDSVFQQCSLLYKHESKRGYFKIDTNSVYSLMTPGNKPLVKSVASVTKANAKRRDKNARANELYLIITATDEEVKQYYRMWIDSVLEKDGWMSNLSVKDGCRLLSNFANSNRDVELKILSIASINGYRDMQWAINKFISETGITKVLTPYQQEAPSVRKRLGSEVF